MINILEKNDFVAYNEVSKNESVQMLGLKKIKCLYCGEYFLKHWRDIKKNNLIICPYCGEKHVNKSNKKFDLKKVENEKNIVSITRNNTNKKKTTNNTKKKKTIKKSNVKKSTNRTTRKTSKT